MSPLRREADCQEPVALLRRLLDGEVPRRQERYRLRLLQPLRHADREVWAIRGRPGEDSRRVHGGGALRQRELGWPRLHRWHFVLPRSIDSPRFRKIEHLGKLHVHHVRLRDYATSIAPTGCVSLQGVRSTWLCRAARRVLVATRIDACFAWRLRSPIAIGDSVVPAIDRVDPYFSGSLQAASTGR